MSQEPRTKGERTRARILDAATELFARSGYHPVSLREIAAHAGMTHAGLLHHFPGKEQLLLEVLWCRDRQDAGHLFPGLLDGDAAGPADAASPQERLRRLVGFVDRNSRTRGLVALYAKLSAEASDPDHPARDYFVRRYRLLREQIADLLAELFAQSPPQQPADPRTVAQQLLAMMDGMQIQWLLEPDAAPMEQRVWDFLGGFGLRPAGTAREGRGGGD
ncbi:TetR family transcriptional regulator [Streptomyces sp. BK208]|uniref:TetR/AcrR family transcriptional regulator n=1 Tax=Streptomyces sp. BK208 TaxID=2512150 RepID=UPI00105D722A|nr:TetR/AcrR family transcriptional regulator [Streptomyces sp. BK208]TDT39682.1 TetR family transcriptional regulator [Streptomyces sp. BK208]